MYKSFAISFTLVILLTPCAWSQSFKVGQKVTFTDRNGQYGGGTVSGIISKDRGPSWEYASRYEVRVDKPNGANPIASFNASELQDASMSVPEIVSKKPQVAAPNKPAGGKFNVGERVSFEDKRGEYGGGWISATVSKDRGENWEYASRYEIAIDGAGNAAYNGDELRHGGGHPAGIPGHNDATGANMPPPQPQVPQANIPRGNSPANLPPANPGEKKNPPAAAQAPAHGAPVKAPARGIFKYAEPNPNPMLGNNALKPAGLKSMYVYTPPGDENPAGRWYTRIGGEFVADGKGPDLNGVVTYIMNHPEAGETIEIRPDGTWMMNDFGKTTRGKWYDIGQNNVRLVGMTPGHDWTASVWKGMITFKSDIGQRKEGNRF